MEKEFALTIAKSSVASAPYLSDRNYAIHYYDRRMYKTAWPFIKRCAMSGDPLMARLRAIYYAGGLHGKGVRSFKSATWYMLAMVLGDRISLDFLERLVPSMKPIDVQRLRNPNANRDVEYADLLLAGIKEAWTPKTPQ
jgi:hypothetical protein